MLLYLDYFRDAFDGHMIHIDIEHQEDVAVENQEHHRCFSGLSSA